MPLEAIGLAMTVVAGLPVFCLLLFIREAKWGGEVIAPGCALLAIAYGFLFANNVAKERAIEEQQHQAIDRGYALRCPADDEFAWIGECEEKEKE